MNIQAIIGKKIDQTQGFLEDGRRVPVTLVAVSGNVVSQIKNTEKEGYNALQIGFGDNKRPNKPEAGHTKKAGLTTAPRFFKEVRVDDAPDAEVGSVINAVEVLEAGDLVDVTGTSKGKGFAGVVKKWHFRGGPKTHGQSDRHRARGSSGSGTTPGRVFKGKKMAGRMGDEQVTVKNLEVLNVTDEQILVRGLVPGIKGSIILIKKVGKNKKFMPLWSEKPENSEDSESQQAGESEDQAASEPEKVDEVKTADEIVETPEETVETAAETVETPEETIKTSEETVETPEEEKAEAVTPEEEVNEEVKGEENANS